MACKNCIKHGVACGYLSCTSLDPMLSLSQHAGDLNVLDLELLHHHCNFTAQTLSENPLLRDFWRINVVKLGLECDYVMRSILSLSALHMAYLDPERKDKLLETSVAHHEMSSRKAVGLMQHVQDTNKAPLFIFSVLTIYIAKNPLIAPIISRTVAHFQVREAPCHHTHLGDLEANINASERDGGLLATYNYAIKELHKLYRVFCEGSEPQDIMDVFIWIAMVADDFLPLLRESRQEALVIFLHFCMLLRQLRSQWWLDVWAGNLYAKTYKLLDDEHRSWIRDPAIEATDICM
ncbi:hypothetical protein CTA1_11911 [Colletotrichum tanaceti]|uniref:Zn(2)-C6 fungal-type domain-containing protein n=1 Tax=Colletotrichum tanaceti TaxID=1306861 RepID=A0A4U6XL05_9PEZI|nr:hypothetical protein CTA1_11911 [Colletotrichum tanaceti]